MTHIDPGSPNGAGKRRDEEDAQSLSDDAGRHEEKNAGSASSGSGSSSGGGFGAGGAGAAGGTSDSDDEFLGVEKTFWMRLLYIVAAGFVAWVSFWFIVILAVAQIIYRLAAGHTNEDLRGFTGNMIQYMRDLLGFITLVRDDRPFLFGGKFPDTGRER